ncbi:sodium-transporting two-sector ATPase [bacterium]|nr:sodium-transporting two-sector ATPase [bacterium]NDC95332.1 sodium-transporting two-sector ATPase [bacterium]NDD85054.1 sodium-transporting two-sector ATPase [bacterium]NDG31514.1 sodium-transporting two-sector ATPase [bacterium]
MANEHFSKLVAAGRPIGEVIAADRFFVRIRGLYTAGLREQILFENGDNGIVWELKDDETTVLNLSSESIAIGTVAVLQNELFSVPTGPELIGRVVSVKGVPLDDKGALVLRNREQVFKTAVPIIDRSASDEQLVTGTIVVDTLFPTVLGQRVAVIGDARTGKTSFLLKAASQSKHLFIFVMINKRKDDVQNLLRELNSSGAIGHSIVIVASVYESLAEAYVAPYVGCAVAEYFRSTGHDVVIIYDDLSNHAKIYREISLLAHTAAGRDSYPGDIFFAHSSLLERAGSFKDNNKTITAFPIVVSPDDDITGYLATNIMSITDGQIIFSRENFQKGLRPAVNIGLSVTRIGGRSRTPKGQELAQILLKKLADYTRALEFSHFQSGQSSTSSLDIVIGERILELLRQPASEGYSVIQQQLLLEVAMRIPTDRKLLIAKLKSLVQAVQPLNSVSVAQYDVLLRKLLAEKGMVDNEAL